MRGFVTWISYSAHESELPAAEKRARKAEGEGFEPSTDGTARNGFRDRRIRPLCHPSSGEGGIRTLEGGLYPLNALAGRRLQPLGHFSVGAMVTTCLAHRCDEARFGRGGSRKSETGFRQGAGGYVRGAGRPHHGSPLGSVRPHEG